MPTISKKYHKATKIYKCSFCGRNINVSEHYYRLFGMAFLGDKPYEVLRCEKCSPVEEKAISTQ